MESFNPQVLPATLSQKEHHKASIVALWAALAALIIGLVYWLIVSPQFVSPPVTNTSPVQTEQTERSDFAEIRDSMSASVPREISKAEETQLKKKTASKPRVLSAEEEAQIRARMGL